MLTRLPVLLAGIWIVVCPAADAQTDGPSFDCTHVTAQVTKLICATPELGVLDRKLAADYDSTVHQGGIDGKALRADEARWLQTVRNRCTTVDCLKAAYAARDAALLDQSLRAASPAAYDDTRPYPASAEAVVVARGLVGQPCGGAPAESLPGTAKIPGFSPIVARDAYVAPLRIGAARFAFLLTYPDTDRQGCTVRSFVTLPAPAAGERFMQCSLADDSHGFGVRQSDGKTVAYWSIDDNAGALRREPIHVIGAQDLRCQQPETGE